MATYPATLSDLRQRVAGLRWLESRPDAELQQALDLADSDLRLRIPALADGAGSVAAAAWGLHLLAAEYHLRRRVERSGDASVPAADLLEIRDSLERGIEQLQRAIAWSSTPVSVEGLKSLGEADSYLLDTDDEEDEDSG